ncbi:glycosyltransferase family 52 [Glaesserella parasuis]|uniref:glycosyltransferase family 52 n=1 Tax=Glaesserella parasuis TaxID=738 RepID=UPI00241506EC|nr:glycosyltransferase family 52 [Glaesserella parasuis]MDG4922401.1 glycosyltransferase family 52 [Glaesserella parasuis]
MNLIICTTPLQSLIASKIIDEYFDEDFIGIMISPIKNSKYDYYSNKLKNKCTHFFSYDMDVRDGKINYINKLIRIKYIGKSLKDIDKIFVSSIDGVNIQLFISSIKSGQRKIITFDDGLANLDRSSFLYSNNRNFLSLLGRLLGNKLDLESLKKSSLKHYTIYRSNKNIIDRLSYISLINREQDNVEVNIYNKEKREVRILIGQPVYELLEINSRDMLYKNVSLMEYVVKKFCIEYYIPHPRERYIVSGVNYIETELIIEDYFLNNLQEDVNYVIYTFFSSALLFLLNFKNIQVISLKPRDIGEKISSSYEILNDNNINIIEI